MSRVDELFRQLLTFMETYGKRLHIIELVMDAYGGLDALRVAESLVPLRYENQRCIRRLRAGLEKAKTRGVPCTVLSEVWKPERMKSMYHHAMQYYDIGCEISNDWLSRMDVLEICLKYNEAILADHASRYVTVHSYSHLVLEHLDVILEFCDKFKAERLSDEEIAAVLKTHDGISRLIIFVTKKQQTIATMNPMKLYSVPYHIRDEMAGDVILDEHVFYVCEITDADTYGPALDLLCGLETLRKVQLVLTAKNLAIRHFVKFPKYIFDRWECIPLYGTVVERHPMIADAIVVSRPGSDFELREYGSLDTDRLPRFLETLLESIEGAKDQVDHVTDERLVDPTGKLNVRNLVATL